MFPSTSVPASIAGLRQAQSAAALKNLNSPVNVSSLDDIYSVDPHASASAQLSSDANAGRATDALINLGGGGQRLGMINGLDDARLAHATDESDQLADLSSGVPQEIARQKLAGQDALAEQASEDAAGREMAPNASALHARNVNDTMNQLLMKYVQGPTSVENAKATAAQGIESTKTAGALAVAHANHVAPNWKGLLDSLTELAKIGKTADDYGGLDHFEKQFGVHVDGTPYAGPSPAPAAPARPGLFGR